MDLYLGIRKYSRYPVNEIIVENVGEVIEMSMGGMKIRRSNKDELESQKLTIIQLIRIQ